MWPFFEFCCHGDGRLGWPFIRPRIGSKVMPFETLQQDPPRPHATGRCIIWSTEWAMEDVVPICHLSALESLLGRVPIARRSTIARFTGLGTNLGKPQICQVCVGTACGTGVPRHHYWPRVNQLVWWCSFTSPPPCMYTPPPTLHVKLAAAAAPLLLLPCCHTAC